MKTTSAREKTCVRINPVEYAHCLFTLYAVNTRREIDIHGCYLLVNNNTNYTNLCVQEQYQYHVS